MVVRIQAQDKKNQIVLLDQSHEAHVCALCAIMRNIGCCRVILCSQPYLLCESSLELDLSRNSLLLSKDSISYFLVVSKLTIRGTNILLKRKN